MKSRTIPLVAVLFAAMLLGIILIQAWWIRRALQLNGQAFDAAVYRSLEGVVKQAGEKENFILVKNEFRKDTLIHGKTLVKVLKKSAHQKKPVLRLPGSHAMIRMSTTQRTQVQTTVISRDGETTAESMTMNVPEPPEPPGTPVPPLAVAPSAEPPEQGLSGHERALLKNKKEEIIDVIIEKMINSTGPDSVSLKPEELKTMVAAQLTQNNLAVPFSFALYKKGGRPFYTGPGFTDTTGSYKINLYPRDLYGRNLLLALSIPGKSMLVGSGLWWVFALSLLFTLAILLLFIYSIRLLIRHKNLLEVKNDFINHMSHELKTPLATISLGADMLMGQTEKMDEAQIRKVGASIKKQSTRLYEDMKQILLNALLDTYQPREELFDLAAACRATLEEMRFLTEDKKAVIITRFEPGQVLMKGDAELWHKVLCNLLDNALKFSKESPEIMVSVIKESRTIKIEVADNGIGIAEKDQPFIFDKFYRSDYYRQSGIQGFGLGLSFVSKIVKAHRGTIRVASKQGQGTAFIIELPDE